MKTPDEIKKGLKCCLEEHACTRCPYDDCDEGWHCVVDRNADALAYIQQLEAKIPKWISVEERLPEKGQTVMVCGVRNGMQVGAFRGTLSAINNRKWSWKKNSCLEITHWMPLPEPPKER